MSIPIIVLSTLTGTANFADSYVPDGYKQGHAKPDTLHFAARNRTFRISRRETGHSTFRGAKPDTPG
eukprot:COSAG02_NODE_4772_length_4994_cov_16.312768_7_plen_67_part_00